MIDQISKENDKAQKTLADLESQILTQNAETQGDSRQIGLYLKEQAQIKTALKNVKQEIEKFQNEIAKRNYD